jgi:hypothetical protein
MGRPVRRLARTPSPGRPCACLGFPRDRKRPTYPSLAMPKVLAPPTAAPPRQGLRCANQREHAPRPHPFCPLTVAYNPRAEPPFASWSSWGFSPCQSALSRGSEKGEEREERRRGEEEAQHRVTADVPLPGTVHGRRGAGRVAAVEEDAHAGRERWSRGRDETPPRTPTPRRRLRQAGNDYTSTPL